MSWPGRSWRRAESKLTGHRKGNIHEVALTNVLLTAGQVRAQAVETVGIYHCNRCSRTFKNKYAFQVNGQRACYGLNCVLSEFMFWSPIASSTVSGDLVFRADPTVPPEGVGTRSRPRVRAAFAACPQRWAGQVTATSVAAWCRSVLGLFRAPVFKMHVDSLGRSVKGLRKSNNLTLGRGHVTGAEGTLCPAR